MTHTPAEWAACLSLGVSGIAVIALALAFADADLAYFDPRPAVRRAGDRLLVEVVNTRLALREAAVSATALLLILSGPTGGT